jgi:hypothetical protein
LHEFPNIFPKGLNDGTLAGGWRITQLEGHHHKDKCPPFSDEINLLAILCPNINLIIPTKPIQKGTKFLVHF